MTDDGSRTLPPVRVDADVDAWLEAARRGFEGLSVAPSVRTDALRNLRTWLTDGPFAAYRPQVQASIEAGRWELLLDSFYRVLPFGTGGRRGPVGVGPNRFNPWTLGASVQGHAAWMRRTFGDRELSVVIAGDVREFRDLGGRLMPDVPSPLMGLRSRDFAAIAAEVYAAAGIRSWLQEGGEPLSTPELSFAIRLLGADGGLQVSASHNPPDDNGGKFYNGQGGQEIPPQDEEMAQEVEQVSFIDRMPLDRARAAGLVREFGEKTHQAYIQANLKCSADPTARSARVLFTNLQGTGRRTVVEVLRAAGFTVAEEPTQLAYDGSFSAVPFRFPNPEVPAVMDAARQSAEAAGCELVMSTDPDADRLGLLVRRKLHGADPDWDGSAPLAERWRFFNGNEIAALVAVAVLDGRRAGRPLVIKTEVTSGLVSRLARARGAQVIEHLLVGFKYIGAVLHDLERDGRHGDVEASVDDFVLGAEESHGVLVTTTIRDKDAAGGALVLAELASRLRSQGRTLCDALEDCWREVGYTRNELLSVVMRGAEGRARIQEIQRSLRDDPARVIGGRAVTAFFDRQDPLGPFGPIVSQTDRDSRDVLVFELGPDARVVLRPSGTEPKNKIYVELNLAPGIVGEAARQRADEEARQLAEDFAVLMLGRVGIELPRWALRISDLVAIEARLDFAARILPELVRRMEAAGAGDEPADLWLDRQLRPLGKDGRRLVADGVMAWIAEAKPSSALRLRHLFGS